MYIGGQATDLAGVAELADALGLGSSEATRGGSSPLARTTVAFFLITMYEFLNTMETSMQIKQVKSAKATAQYDIVVPANDVSVKVKASLADYAKKADIPGFRKGKAPTAILEQRFGQNALGDAMNALIQSAMEKIVKDDSLRVGMQPGVDIKSADTGKDLEFSMSFVLLPEVKFMDFSSIELETFKAIVAKKDVDEALEKIAKDFRETESVDRKAKKGDVAVIDFLGKVDGVEFEGGQGSDYSLELGSNSFIPGFEDQLIGLKAGDKKDVEVAFPEGYHAESMAGKPAVFECEVKEVKAYVETKIDDDFAKKVGLDDLTALKINVEERLAGQFDSQTRNLVKTSLMDQLVAGHDMDIADEMVSLEFDDLWKQVQAAKESGQLDVEDAGKSDEELKAEYRSLSERRVKLGVLLTDLAQEFKVEVGQDDIQRAVMEEAQRYPGQEMQVFEYYQKNPKVLEQLRAPLLEEKVVDVLIEKATTTVKEMSADDIVKMLEGDTEVPANETVGKKTTAKKSTAKKATAKKA